MIDVSIIIPFYNGERFLKNSLTMLSSVVEYSSKKGVYCEVVFVDDNPDNPLKRNSVSEFLKIVKLVHNKKNIGIHGSRIEGLKNAEGEFVLFLDQDDILKKDAIVSQKKHLMKNDVAVVCNGFVCNNKQGIKRKIYGDEDSIKKVNSLDEVIKANRIISPGQVMIRKNKIPEIWKQDVLENQGADDYLLWLLVLIEGNSFSINTDFLFFYNKSEYNSSLDLRRMTKSKEEIFRYLKKNKKINDEDYNNRKKNDMISSQELLYKYYTLSVTIETWLSKELQGRHISEWFESKGIKRIAIHGMGVLGSAIYNSLKENSVVDIIFAVDKQANRYELDIPVYTMGEVLKNRLFAGIDILIVAIGEKDDEVMEEWEKTDGINAKKVIDILAEL